MTDRNEESKLEEALDLLRQVVGCEWTAAGRGSVGGPVNVTMSDNLLRRIGEAAKRTEAGMGAVTGRNEDPLEEARQRVAHAKENLVYLRGELSRVEGRVWVEESRLEQWQSEVKRLEVKG